MSESPPKRYKSFLKVTTESISFKTQKISLKNFVPNFHKKSNDNRRIKSSHIKKSRSLVLGETYEGNIENDFSFLMKKNDKKARFEKSHEQPLNETQFDLELEKETHVLVEELKNVIEDQLGLKLVMPVHFSKISGKKPCLLLVSFFNLNSNKYNIDSQRK